MTGCVSAANFLSENQTRDNLNHQRAAGQRAQSAKPILNFLMQLVQLSILLALVLFYLFSATPAHCQTGRIERIQPIIRHSLASTLPHTIAIVGKIVAVSPGYCSYYCWGGTVKVRLTEPIIDYGNRYAFVVTACLHETDTSCIVSVKASKLRQQEKECYYTNIGNTIDSQIVPHTEAMPFYKLSERETRKLEQDELRRK